MGGIRSVRYREVDNIVCIEVENFVVKNGNKVKRYSLEEERVFVI